jgi:sulfate adenylyltransferase subunit 2
MDETLRRLENQSIFIFREAKNKFKNPAILWSMGKDSTTMLALCKKAFFGTIPFPVVHLDTGYKFKEMIEFRDRVAKEWGFKLIIAKPNTQYTPFDKTDDPRKNCCNERKTELLKKVMLENGFDAVFVGIRRDEHGIRNKEHVFSPRDEHGHWVVTKENKAGDSGLELVQDIELEGWGIFATEFKEAHSVRIHPIIHWSELNIWKYGRDQNLPAVPLYFAKNGKRYRSIGCVPCTAPIDSNADTYDKIVAELETTKTGERDGRAQDKEDPHAMENLRRLGYM